MSVIDLDKKIKVDNHKVNIKIAGKTYSLNFDDNFTKLVSTTYLEVSKAFKPIKDIEFLDEDIEVQKQDVSNAVNEARDLSIKTFDKLLGKGEGKRLYNYYNHSTNALATVLGSLSDLSEKSIQVSKKKQVKHFNSAR